MRHGIVGEDQARIRREVAADLLDAMRAADGAGLAAPQIGVEFGAGSTPFRAVDNVSLHVDAGEVLGIVGSAWEDADKRIANAVSATTQPMNSAQKANSGAPPSRTTGTGYFPKPPAGSAGGRPFQDPAEEATDRGGEQYR